MTANRFRGPLVGGPHAGQWIVSEGPVFEVFVLATSPIARYDAIPEPVHTDTHRYHFEPLDPAGAGFFRHPSLTSPADLMRELLTHYRPPSTAR